MNKRIYDMAFTAPFLQSNKYNLEIWKRKISYWTEWTDQIEIIWFNFRSLSACIEACVCSHSGAVNNKSLDLINATTVTLNILTVLSSTLDFLINNSIFHIFRLQNYNRHTENSGNSCLKQTLINYKWLSWK